MIANKSKRLTADQVLEHPWMKKDTQTPGISATDPQVKFCKYRRPGKTTSTALACLLSDNQIKDLSQTFQTLDQDAEGLLSYTQLIGGTMR